MVLIHEGKRITVKELRKLSQLKKMRRHNKKYRDNMTEEQKELLQRIKSPEDLEDLEEEVNQTV